MPNIRRKIGLTSYKFCQFLAFVRKNPDTLLELNEASAL